MWEQQHQNVSPAPAPAAASPSEHTNVRSLADRMTALTEGSPTSGQVSAAASCSASQVCLRAHTLASMQCLSLPANSRHVFTNDALHIRDCARMIRDWEMQGAPSLKHRLAALEREKVEVSIHMHSLEACIIR